MSSEHSMPPNLKNEDGQLPNLEEGGGNPKDEIEGIDDFLPKIL